MPVTVVVGGQFGSEGKGKVASLMAAELSASAVVRVGGPNSGHTPHVPGVAALQQLPTAVYSTDCLCILPAGSYIDVELFFKELARTAVAPDRVVIDGRASIVTPEDRVTEEAGELAQTIGSTASGTGRSVMNRVARDGRAVLAREVPELQHFIGDTSSLLRDLLNRGHRVIVEGTQGYGLSLLHSGAYPFVTSRDVTAAGAVSEAGLSPLDVDVVALVLRAFPIRVGGNSGPLNDELSWEDLSDLGRHDHAIAEFTTVTKRLRRVGMFDPELVRRAIATNRPNMIVLNHLDYVDHDACDSGEPSREIARFVAKIESAIGQRIDRWGVGRSGLVEPTRITPDPARRMAATSRGS